MESVRVKKRVFRFILGRPTMWVVCVWFFGWILPAFGLPLMVRVNTFVPDGFYYYPPDWMYWMQSGFLRGWKGVWASVYCWILSKGFQTSGAIVSGVAFGLLLLRFLMGTEKDVEVNSNEDDDH